MPPKKKGGGKKGGRRESIAGSLGDAMRDLKRKLDEGEMMLQEEQKVRERVTREKQGMEDQLASLKQTLSQEQSKHDEVLERMERENVRRSALLAERIKNLEAHRKELEQSLHSHDLVEGEHTRLCHVVNTLKEEVGSEVKAHEEEESKLREEAFNMRMQLENVSRRTLRELDREYERRAVTQMREGSTQAANENQQLCDELAQQSESVLTLMHAQDTMTSRLHDAHIERTMLQDTSSLQANRIKSLERRHAGHETDIIAMQTRITQLHAENKELEDRELRTIAGVQQLQQLRERFKAAQRDAHHRKAATVNFVRVLLAVTSGPAAAQAKLQRLATTPDTAIIDELTAAQYQASEPAEPEPELEDDEAMRRIWNSQYSQDRLGPLF